MTEAERQARFRSKLRALAEEPQRLPSGNYTDFCHDCGTRIVGLDGVRSDIAMLRTPDGHSKRELAKYHAPAAVGAEPEHPPPNTLGLHRVMFAVDDIDATVARLRAHGAALLGEVAQYEDSYRLCYLRGPDGIILELAERIA